MGLAGLSRSVSQKDIGREREREREGEGERLTSTVHANPTVLKHCIKLDPRNRPSINDVVRRLDRILKETETTSSRPAASLQQQILGDTSQGASNPWAQGSAFGTALVTFASRIKEKEGAAAKLEELSKHVESKLGAPAVDPVCGVYNSPRLYRFLLAHEMDVQDATSAVVMNSSGRAEFAMDAKREAIGEGFESVGEGARSGEAGVRESGNSPPTPPLVTTNLGFSTLPRAEEFRKYIPSNPFVGRAKDGRVVRYNCIGRAADLDGFQNAFSIGDALDLLLYHVELSRMLLDALSAIDGRNIASISFYDCSGREMNSLFHLMSCESGRVPVSRHHHSHHTLVTLTNHTIQTHKPRSEPKPESPNPAPAAWSSSSSARTLLWE